MYGLKNNIIGSSSFIATINHTPVWLLKDKACVDLVNTLYR